MRNRPTSVLLALVAAVVLAIPATPASASADGDIPLAEAGTIQAGDIPAAFTETTPPSSQVGLDGGGDNPLVRAVAKTRQCKRYAAAFGGTPEGVTASAQGAQYDDAESQASSSVMVFETSAQAEQLFDHVADPKLARCLNRLFRTTVKQSGDELAGRGVELAKLTAHASPHPVPPVGDETTSYQTEITMRIAQKGSGPEGSVERATIHMFTDIQFVRVGRALALYNFLGVDAPIDAVQEPAVAAASTRLREALGG